MTEQPEAAAQCRVVAAGKGAEPAPVFHVSYEGAGNDQFAMENLRNKSIHAGLANTSGQIARVFIKLLSTMILARLLAPGDYGLVTMAATFTGFLGLFSSLGLYHAAIQCDSVSTVQSSTLFWITFLFGVFLFALCVGLAPAVASFYGDPKLVSTTMIIGITFIISGAGIQHEVLLSRQMRYGTAAIIELVSDVISTAAAIYIAWFGYGYFALAYMIVLRQVVVTAGMWYSTGWVPNRPHFDASLMPLLRFGRAMTLTTAATFIAGNLQKVMIGKVWGEQAVGLYSRGSYLIAFPVEALNGAIGEVAFNALSKVKNDNVRLRLSFLQIFSWVIALTLPITVACALFADDLIAVLLGPKWSGVVPIFRLLTPAVLLLAIDGPIGWLLSALGLAEKNLRVTLVSTPLILVGMMIGLSYGPSGVALAYSVIMLLKFVPMTIWALDGTGIGLRDILTEMRAPIISSAIAGIICYFIEENFLQSSPTLLRLSVVLLLFFAAYALMLLRSNAYRAALAEVLRIVKGGGLDSKKFGLRSAG